MKEPMVKNGKPSSAELKAAMEADRKERAQACSNEIEAILKKYDCIIAAHIEAQGNMAKALPTVIAR